MGGNGRGMGEIWEDNGTKYAVFMNVHSPTCPILLEHGWGHAVDRGSGACRCCNISSPMVCLIIVLAAVVSVVLVRCTNCSVWRARGVVWCGRAHRKTEARAVGGHGQTAG